MERVAVVSKESSELAPAGLTVDGLRAPDLQDSREADSGLLTSGLTGGGLRAPDLQDSCEADPGLLTCRTHGRRTPGS